jgi:putative spermidine/putrescine transport system ATP-binding protein
MTGALQLRQVSKRYGDIVALQDVSLDVASGEFLTLLGPSGSGKTTTLQIVAGFVVPEQGTVVLDGRDLTRVPPHRRNIGIVFQNYALFPHMTVSENVAFPLESRGVPRNEARRRVGEALETVRLEGLDRRLPRQLSGGQQQRVALARAIVFRPPLLLMDEPLGALDKKLRERLQLEIMEISRGLGVTVIYVTHDQEEALFMSHRIAVYHRGRIEQLGTPAQLYERPASAFVAGFVGDSNMFTGVVDRSGPVPIMRVGARAIRLDEKQAGRLAGERLSVVVRPERLRVDRPGGEAPGTRAVRLAGRIREAIYLGAVRKYVIDLELGTRAIARVPTGGETDGLAIGVPVEVSWDPADGVLVAGEHDNDESDPGAGSSREGRGQ